MSIIRTNSRNQLKMIALEEMVEKDSIVRTIDTFVDQLNLEELGFNNSTSTVGRPSYPVNAMVKLYLYGYMHDMRTTRVLAKGCKINLELRWLLCELFPSYRTIGEFRKNNGEAFENIFQKTVDIAIINKLIGGKTLAFDSFPIRASNSKKNSYKDKKLDFLKEHARGKLNNYVEELAKDDMYTNEEQDSIEEKIEHYENQLDKYEQIENQLKEDGVNQVSYTDADARILPKGDFGNFLGYRIQCGADSKHKLVCGYEVCNDNDIKHAHSIAQITKQNIGTNKFDALYDKGYHSGPEMAKLAELNVTPYISIPKPNQNKVISVSEFKYNKRSDTYTCPANQRLKTNGRWLVRKNRKAKHYSNPKACRNCPMKAQCTTRKAGRLITRYDHYEYVEANKKRIEKRPDYYRQRSQIIEHIFGTIKRHWGIDHALLRTKKKVKIEFAIAFTCYNLKRIKTILGDKLLKQLNNRLKSLHLSRDHLEELIQYFCSIFYF